MTILCRNCGDKDCRHTNSAHLGQLSCFKKKQQSPQTEQAEASSLSDLLSSPAVRHDLFEKTIAKCGDGNMTPEERRAAYPYFCWGIDYGTGRAT